MTAVRNPHGDAILQHGFAECEAVLSLDLCTRLVQVSLEGAALISNAVQKDVTGSLQEEVSGEPTVQWSFSSQRL